jgi:hypothetical protein
MATVIEEFVAQLGWEVDSTSLKQFEKSLQDAGTDFDKLATQAKQADAAVNAISAGSIDNLDTSAINAGISVRQLERQFHDAGFTVDNLVEKIKKYVFWLSAAAGAVSAPTVAINQHTTEQTNLARSVGLSADSLIAWTGLVKEMGFQADNVVDLVEEMNNKIGEKTGLGQMTAVEESLRLLKLDFQEIRKLKPEDQFFAILNAAKELEDVQQAVSAVDMLLGGEANKILGFLRTQEESLETIIERRKALIVLDEEGREGAMRFTRVWTMFTGVVASLGQQFAGLLGDSFTPALNEFIDFVVANRDLIRVETKKWVERVSKALKFFFGILKDIFIILQRLVKAVGGFENALRSLAIVVASMQAAKMFKAVQKAIKGATLAQNILLARTKLFAAIKNIGLVAGFALLLLIIEDIYTWIQGGDSLLKDFSKKFEGVIGSVVERLAGVFGLTKDELDLILSRAFESFVQFFVDTYNGAVAFVEKILGAFDKLLFGSEDVFTRIKNFVLSILDIITSTWSGAFTKLGEIASGVVDQVKMLFDRLKTFVGGIIDSIVAKVPSFIKDLIGGGASFVQNIAPVAGATVAGTVGAGAIGQSVANQTANYEVRNNIQVTQQPGESGTDFANRVSKVIEENTAAAVRNNRTGVVY